MKRKIDTISLAIGMILSAIVAALYDAIKNMILGNNAEVTASMVAIITTTFIVTAVLCFSGFFKREDDGDTNRT